MLTPDDWIHTVCAFWTSYSRFSTPFAAELPPFFVMAFPKILKHDFGDLLFFLLEQTLHKPYLNGACFVYSDIVMLEQALGPYFQWRETVILQHTKIFCTIVCFHLSENSLIKNHIWVSWSEKLELELETNLETKPKSSEFDQNLISCYFIR